LIFAVRPSVRFACKRPAVSAMTTSTARLAERTASKMTDALSALFLRNDRYPVALAQRDNCSTAAARNITGCQQYGFSFRF
jgi:hypothetical protein